MDFPTLGQSLTPATATPMQEASGNVLALYEDSLRRAFEQGALAAFMTTATSTNSVKDGPEWDNTAINDALDDLEREVRREVLLKVRTEDFARVFRSHLDRLKADDGGWNQTEYVTLAMQAATDGML